MEAQKKEYISMLVFVDPVGKKRPMGFVTSDGRKILINDVLDVQPAASLKVGGIGIRYKCQVGRSVIYFFDDDGRWFYEITNKSQ